MKMLTRAPNNFINAAPQPRRLHAPHPCGGSLASRPGSLSYGETPEPQWRADDAAVWVGGTSLSRYGIASRPGGLSYGETPGWHADDAAAPEIEITPPLYRR